MLGGGVIAVLGLTLPATAAAAPPPGNAISGVSAVCQADGMFQVTVNFSHRGAVEVRVYDVIGGALTDSDHAWYYRKGSATFQGLLWGGGGDKVTIETHLLTNGPHHTLVDVVTPTSTNAGSCVAAS
jgi:hypothetical protein